MTGPGSHPPNTDCFTYAAGDGVQTSSPATVTLTVSAVAPVANNDTYQTLENHQLFLDGAPVLANDYSPDNMPLQSIQLTQPAHGTAILSTSGTITYTPNNNYVGTDSFTYDDSDGSLTSNVATITINVKASDTTPTASNLNYTLAHDTSLSTDSSSGLLSGASDSDGDTLLPVLVNGPKDGTLQLTNYGDGSFTYTPNAGFFGTDSFTFQMSDGISTTNTATVTLTVTNDTPTANPDSYSVLANAPTSVSAANGVLTNDSDGEGDALTAVLVSQPTHGNVTLNSDGSFTFHPFGFTGSDSFTYKGYDGVNYSSPTTVTLTSNPVAAAESYSVTHDQTLSTDATDGLLMGAVDADGDPLTAALASGASHGTVTVNNDGSFTYTPTTHYTGTDTFTYTVSDGTNISAPATVTIDITDDVPTVNPQSWDTPENTALSVNAANGVLASSSDDDGDSLTAQLVGGTSNGIVQLGSDGAISYTPNTGFFGTDSFTYDVTDGVSISAPATVTIDVNEVLSQSNNDFRAAATGHFNNDGNPDFVAANYSTNSVSIFLGNGDGTFQTPTVYNVGRGPLAVVVGNFGNGSQDIAVANSLDNTVSILMNNGSGSFTASQVINVGADPVSIAVGNYRGTGVEDLAVANKGANTVSILQNNGSGVFSVISTVNVGTSPDSVAAGDLNGDGKAELVVANSGSNNISVLLSNGNDTFAAPVNYAAGSGPTSVAVADLNGDGKQDVAVANGGSNNVSVLIGNGNGTLNMATTYTVGSDPVSMAVGDFNGDGLPDLGIVNHGSNDDTELLNSGDGGFLDSQVNPLGDSPDAVAVADFNKDGAVDQIVDGDPEDVKGVKVSSVFPKTDALALAPPISSYAAGFSKAGHVIRVWNVDSISGIKDITLPEGTTSAPMAFSPKDPSLLAIGIGGVVSIYNIQTGKTVATWKYFDGTIPITALAFSADGTQLAVGAAKTGKNPGDGMVWQVKVNAVTHTLAVIGEGIVLPESVTPIRQILITADGFGTTVTAIAGAGVQTWYRAAEGQPTFKAEKRVTSAGPIVTYQPSSIAISQDRRYLLVGYTNGLLTLYGRGLAGGLTDLSTDSGHEGAAVVGVGFNAFGGPVKVDVNGLTVFKKGSPLTSIGGLIKNPNGITSGVISATGNTVFMGAKDGSVNVYWVVVDPPSKLGDPFTINGTPLILRS